MAGPYICEGVRTCALCGCTDEMGCADACGNGCAWSHGRPDVCTACERTAAALDALTEALNAPGATAASSVDAFAAACAAHRIQGYGG